MTEGLAILADIIVSKCGRLLARTTVEVEVWKGFVWLRDDAVPLKDVYFINPRNVHFEPIPLEMQAWWTK